MILNLWDRAETSELAHAAAWLTSWVALTGARGAMVMASELLWTSPGSVEVGVGEYVECRDSKSGRNRQPNSALHGELLESVGVESLSTPPQRLRMLQAHGMRNPAKINRGEQSKNSTPFMAGSGGTSQMRAV